MSFKGGSARKKASYETYLTWAADDQRSTKCPFHLQKDSRLVIRLFSQHFTWPESAIALLSASSFISKQFWKIYRLFFVWYNYFSEHTQWSASWLRQSEHLRQLHSSSCFSATGSKNPNNVFKTHCSLWFPQGFMLLMFVVLHMTYYIPLWTLSEEEKIKLLSPGKPCLTQSHFSGRREWLNISVCDMWLEATEFGLREWTRGLGCVWERWRKYSNKVGSYSWGKALAWNTRKIVNRHRVVLSQKSWPLESLL